MMTIDVKSDIKYMVEDTIKQMKLLADEKQIERITSGLLYQGKKNTVKPFEALYYDEVRQIMGNASVPLCDNG